jgi:hypothetical protein
MKQVNSRPCPYCFEPIASQALRCNHCAGQLRDCPHCKQKVGVVTRQKFVGLIRGGMKTRLRCLSCDRVLDGPRL